ncbi:MAG: LON peptidase substrate-binding domain-containing protein [Acidobacteriota bacterium]|nr:LON peptidase substrate-binding domain-containing protein [Acidobacteriota bacterium]
MARLLPLFPLQLVVFPRTQLPLHIFEERYKEMVSEAIAQASEFGVVLANKDGIVNAGCTVIVDKVLTKYPDGRMDIVTRGSRRFEITTLNQEKAYLRGEVEFFDDEEPGPAPAELRDEALEHYRGLLAAGEGRAFAEPVLSDPQLSFQLAQAVDDLDFQSVMLRNRSEADRLKQLSSFLNEYVPRMKETTRMKQLAPLNGFGHKPVGL